MKLRVLHTIIFLFILACGFTQQIPEGYRVNWSHAGSKVEFVEKNSINFKVQQGKNPEIPNNELINSLIQSIGEEGGVIYFPKGTYQFDQTIRLKSNVSLIGEHKDSVQLLFNNNGKGDLIALNGKLGEKISPLSDLTKNSNQLELRASVLKVGDLIYVNDNDENLVSDKWAMGCTGQIFEVTKIKENKITLLSEARRSFAVENGMQVQRIVPIENCHIRNLSISRSDRTDVHSGNIFINYASNCTVSNVKSTFCSYAHIVMEKSYRCSVTSCVVSKALNYAKGGNGYGVVVQFGTSDCKIENNEFHTLRHAMLAQCGANGNVFNNNVSENPVWTGTMLPKHAAGDIVLHGNYPYANQFIRNRCQQIVIDNSHGMNGSYNQFLENTVAGYGIYMNRKSGDHMVFVKNEVKRKGWLKGRFRIKGEGHFLLENVRKGKKLTFDDL